MIRRSLGPRIVEAVEARGIDDASLIRAVQRRDESAFETLYRRHATAVYAVTVREVHDADVASELTHVAFVRMWERAATIRTESLRLRPWLIMVARNAGMDMARRRKPVAALEEVPVAIAPDRAEDEALQAERSTAVRLALEALPTEQWLVVELAYFGGLTQSEIAETLSEPLGTVKSRIRLAMQKMRDALGPFREEFA